MLRILISILILSSGVSAATSISENGITWYFAEDEVVGRYVNGHPWVLDDGEVTLVGYDPAPSFDESGKAYNGAMINPMRNSKQGIDARGTSFDDNYLPQLNVGTQLPLMLQAGDSLLTVASNLNYPKKSRSALRKAAVLTCVDTVPAENAFRPNYFGTEKFNYTTDNLNLDLLPDLSKWKVPGASNIKKEYDKLRNVQVDLLGLGGEQASSDLSTFSNPNYGRNIQRKQIPGIFALMMNWSDEKKMPVAIDIVQRGIDVYGGVRAGYKWMAGGGHRNGRKVNLFMAAMLLEDETMKEWCSPNAYPAMRVREPSFGEPDTADRGAFQEDQQFFYVTQWDIDKKRKKPKVHVAYPQSTLGMPEYTDKAWNYRRSWASADWPGGPHIGGYRYMNSSNAIECTLVVTLMRGRDVWDNPVFFEYAERAYYVFKKGLPHPDWPDVPKTPRESPFVPVDHQNGFVDEAEQLWDAYYERYKEETKAEPQATSSSDHKTNESGKRPHYLGYG